MIEPHAVIAVAPSLRRFLRDVHLPIWRPATAELNELWRQNGRYQTDVYFDGSPESLTVRQARAHGFLFVGGSAERFALKDVAIRPDIVIRRACDAKDFETQIGQSRVRMRRSFGNIIRGYAWTRATYFHGSEVETVVRDHLVEKRIYGLPPTPMLAAPRTQCLEVPSACDGPVDEKLVSLLDYTCHRVKNVIYVGAGDGRTLLSFRRKDPTRAQAIHWTLIDPITPDIPHDNVLVVRTAVRQPSDIVPYRRDGPTALIWDVRSDRGTLDDDSWERRAASEDLLGRAVAEGNRWLDISSIKLRIPTGGLLTLRASCVTFQPGAPSDMYELRVIYSHQRDWLPVSNITLDLDWIRRMVPLVHGRDRGRRLRTSLIQFLHIERRDAFHCIETPRADLFYLTNARNSGADIFTVVERSEVSTLWASREPTLEYDDIPVSRTEVMLRCSTETHCVVDGLGFVLLLMFLHELDLETSFDPQWAARFIVVFRRRDLSAVPDVWLCRFIGLRVASSIIRIRDPGIHRVADLVKSTGLDVSGHLFVTLVSGAYAVDLICWFRMIVEWSVLGREAKLKQLAQAGAEVIEWKDDRADQAWHRPEDLRAALKIFSRMCPSLSAFVEARLDDLRIIERTQGKRSP
ncbi:capping enzyme [Chenuda virus]|uniref:Core protein VP4 n=1 Tax=Chenuda virus TaxID=40065 RepID=A0A0H4MKA1_9REOV|nr:capping enzyme [Chenuda virus]AKP24087.1 capping enzyme [Chenuda virus]